MKKGILFIVLIAFACNKKTINLELTAEEMFTRAKRVFIKENFLDAITEFTAVTLRFPGSTVADSAQFYLGECHFELDEFLLAASEYERLLNQYPQSLLVDDAQFKMGMSYYQLSPRAQLDQEYTVRAIEEFQKFLEEYPESGLTPQVQQKIDELRTKLAEKEFRNAEIYRKLDYYRAAITYYEVVLNGYYDTSYAGDSFFLKAECYYFLGDLEKSSEFMNTFLQKYPENKHRPEALVRLKEIQGKLKKSDTVSLSDTTGTSTQP